MQCTSSSRLLQGGRLLDRISAFALSVMVSVTVQKAGGLFLQPIGSTGEGNKGFLAFRGCVGKAELGDVLNVRLAQ